MEGADRMYYKQIIIVNKELNMSKGKMAAQVSHASMAFLTRMIQKNAKIVRENQYPVWMVDHFSGKKKDQMYRRGDLNQWAKEARERGEDFFYARPVNADNPYGPLELCEENHHYNVSLDIDKDLFEQWMGGIFTKVILEAKNEAQMIKIVEKAKNAGMIENVDFFCIRDACLTELTPDETGTRWTCIGFKPMDAERIDPITKRLQLFKE